MKDTKRRLEIFSFYDRTGIEKHLAKMAEKGWLVEKIGFFWSYRRIEPKALTFSVCYYPRASQFDPEPSEEQETFYDFCAHTGWTLAAASAQMQVFYNERTNPIPIETDPVLEVDAIHRAAKKSFLYPQFLLLAAITLNGGTMILKMIDDLFGSLVSGIVPFSVVWWPVLFLACAVELSAYFLWRHRARKAAARGEFLETKGHPVFQKVMLAVITILFVWSLVYIAATGSPLWTVVGVVSLLVVLAIVLVVNGVREALRRKKVSADTNRVVTWAVQIGLTFLVLALVPVLVLSWDQAMLRQEARVDELPLVMGDLMEAGAESYSQWRNTEQSPLLIYDQVRQYSADQAGMADLPGIDYSVVVVKAPFLYGVCREEMLYRYDTRDNNSVPEGWKGYYTPTDPSPWGAEEAYQDYRENTGLRNEYLLCYPDRIVEITFDWEPTPEQMATVGEKLGG